MKCMHDGKAIRTDLFPTGATPVVVEFITSYGEISLLHSDCLQITIKLALVLLNGWRLMCRILLQDCECLNVYIAWNMNCLCVYVGVIQIRIPNFILLALTIVLGSNT